MKYLHHDKLTAYLSDETGATAIEYALIATLISLAVFGSGAASGLNMSGNFQIIADRVN